MKLDLDRVRQQLGETLYTYVVGRPADMPASAADPNEEALARYRLIPRLLAGRSGIDPSLDHFGLRAAAPIGIGAFAADRIICEAGIMPIVRAAADLRLPITVSEECLTPLSEITAAHDHAFLQLRAAGSLERTLELIRQAAEHGIAGIVMTALAPVHPRPGLYPGGVDIAAEIGRRSFGTIGDPGGVSRLPAFPAWSWSDLRQVAAVSAGHDLPLILKGVLHEADAQAALAAGCAGIMVSNIGVRQLYRWAPAVERLAPVREACGPHTTVILDGGIRNGADIVVATALGASLATMVRPVVFALVQGGEGGVRSFLSRLIDDVATIAAWAGAGSLSDLSIDQVARV